MRVARERVAVIGLLLLTFAWAAYLGAQLPALTEYHFGADEGTYARQAGAVVDGGLSSLSTIAREYVERPEARDFPPPLRVGHILIAALALSVRRSITTLSWLSLGCHLATVALVLTLGRRIWGARVALLAAGLTLVSPLASGLALRALADAHHALSVSATLLSLLAFLTTERRRYFVGFLGALAWSLLVKESAYFLLPFYIGVLVWARRGRPQLVSWRDVAVAALAVPGATLGLTAALLGGPTPFLRAVALAAHGNAAAPHAYLRAYGSGPWFEYVVDGLLLSPGTTLAFLLFVGHRLTGDERAPARTLPLAFAGYVLAVFALLPKNPRFVAPLEIAVRFGAVAMACALADRFAKGERQKLPLTVALVVALGLLDVASFRRHFVVARTYDPVAYNLLANVRMIPVDEAAPDARAAMHPSPEALLSLSRRRLEARDFRTSAEASRAALSLRPDYAEAFNNLGLALAELGRRDEAIAAFESALRIRPSFELARNNLAWTRAHGAAEPR